MCLVSVQNTGKSISMGVTGGKRTPVGALVFLRGACALTSNWSFIVPAQVASCQLGQHSSPAVSAE